MPDSSDESKRIETMALAPMSGVLDEAVERLAAGVLEQARVLVDLAAAQRAEAGHEVAPDAAAADDEPEDLALRSTMFDGRRCTASWQTITMLLVGSRCRCAEGTPPALAGAQLGARAAIAQQDERVVARLVAVGPVRRAA